MWVTSKNYFELYFGKTALKKNLENHNYPAKILFNYLIQFWRVLNIFERLLDLFVNLEFDKTNVLKQGFLPSREIKKLSYQIGLLNKLFKKGFGGIFYEK